jgi:TctA family transporter
MAMITASLIVAALLSWISRIWEQREKIESKDWAIIVVASFQTAWMQTGTISAIIVIDIWGFTRLLLVPTYVNTAES